LIGTGKLTRCRNSPIWRSPKSDSIQNYIEPIITTAAAEKWRLLIADPSKAKEKLGWKPNVDFSGLGQVDGRVRYGDPKTARSRASRVNRLGAQWSASQRSSTTLDRDRVF